MPANPLDTYSADNVKATTASTASSSAISEYGGSNTESRLTTFTYPDPASDANRLAYIRIIPAPGPSIDTSNLFSDLSEANLTSLGINTSTLKTLQSQLVSTGSTSAAETVTLSQRYTKFILESVQTNRVEKTQIMQTFGDTFAAIFTGRQPNIISVSGSLVFDYTSSDQRQIWSWYHAFINAYEFYLRASRLAKWKMQVRLAIPDLATYDGYIISINEQHASDNDMLIPFNFSMLLTSPPVVKPMLASDAASGTTPDNSKKTQTPANGTAFQPGTTVNYDNAGNIVSVAPENTQSSKATADQTALADTDVDTKITLDSGTSTEAPPTITKQESIMPPPPNKLGTTTTGQTRTISTVSDYDRYKNFEQSITTLSKTVSNVKQVVNNFKNLQNTVNNSTQYLRGVVTNAGALLGRRIGM